MSAEIPNEETINAIKEVEAMEKDRSTIEKIYTSTADMFADLLANA